MRMKANLLKLRDTQQPAYIAFSAADTWLARTLRYITAGDVSHAFFICRLPPFIGWWTLGADANGLVWAPLPNLLDPVPYVFKTYGIWNGLIALQQWIDCPYDVRGLVGMGWVELMFRLTGRYVTNPGTDTRALFCSAFSTMVMRVDHPNILPGIEPRSVDPQMLKQWCLQDAAFYRVGIDEIGHPNHTSAARAPT